MMDETLSIIHIFYSYVINWLSNDYANVTKFETELVVQALVKSLSVMKQSRE